MVAGGSGAVADAEHPNVRRAAAATTSAAATSRLARGQHTDAWRASPAAHRYHYGIASALGYALSMFSETLRDRRLVTLDQDLVLLILGFVIPMVSVVIDGFTYGSTVSISPAQYWVLFGFGT